jgi:hypothetical protein
VEQFEGDPLARQLRDQFGQVLLLLVERRCRGKVGPVDGLATAAIARVLEQRELDLEPHIYDKASTAAVIIGSSSGPVQHGMQEAPRA